ncbi:type VII secretion-associated serine protease mycosin [Streptomyces sp. NPDC052773]|uniref:type VII secretion-associated serine protease mycosin n=1 Tax=Streptomyces sp. NPDC052773 TaxID=3365693 RepID=UPI0037CFCD1C
MPTNRTTHPRLRAAACLIAGFLLVGGTANQAHADSTRSQQWHLDAMRAEEMWQVTTGKGITVAVLDSGVDPDNPDLRGRVLKGRDFAPADRPGDEHTDYDEELGHGTGMAGLIAGTGAYGGGKGAFGLAPGAKILPVRLPATADYNAKKFNEKVAEAIRYAADAGARVINLSVGLPRSPQLTSAVRYALKKGSLVFAAVGNNGDKNNDREYPAAEPGVVGVAAVGKDLHRTSFSQYGPQVDMAAPGEDMVHACGTETGLCKTSGTSDATALASASAALIWSKHPTWTNNQVLRVMLNTIGAPTDGAKRNDSIGYGIVRPRIALQNPGDPGPADDYPLPDLPAAASSPSPAASAPASPEAGSAAEDHDTTGANATGAQDDDSTLRVALGVGAAVVLAAAGAAVVVARTRRRATPPPPPGSPLRQTAYGGGQFTQPGPDGGTPHGSPYSRRESP